MALGLVVGAGVTLLARRGPSGHRPAGVALRATGRGAAEVADRAERLARRGARRAAAVGADLRDAIPVEEIAETVSEYLASAREAIDETVAHELRDLRKSIRHRRKKLGL